jgi:hypothetical protein
MCKRWPRHHSLRCASLFTANLFRLLARQDGEADNVLRDEIGRSLKPGETGKAKLRDHGFPRQRLHGTHLDW